MQLALSSGSLRVVAEAHWEKSHLADSTYALMSGCSHLIERFPLERLRQSARQRVRLLSRLERLHELARLPLEQRRGQFRARPEWELPLAWAIPGEQPIPPDHFGTLRLLLSVVLALLYLLPGLAYLAWGWPRWRRHDEVMKILVRKWLVAGKPDPVDGSFQRLLCR